ncbi:MAG: hypothetical protein M3N43_11390, partial [Actinomycetota bacterium]|nr:hypothetical protein [Actinomycetota bacterium]
MTASPLVRHAHRFIDGPAVHHSAGRNSPLRAAPQPRSCSLVCKVALLTAVGGAQPIAGGQSPWLGW